MMKYLLFSLFVLFLVVFLSLFSSCSYKEAINLQQSFGKGIYNQDSSRIAFFHTIKAYKYPKGLATFPDGGKSKTMYVATTVYLLDIADNKLHKIYTYPTKSKQEWIDFDLQGNLYFNLQSIHIVKSETYDKFKKKEYEKYSSLYCFNAQTHQLKKLVELSENPKFSSDKEKIAYQIFDVYKTAVYVIDKNGANNQKIDFGENPMFSPNGKYIAYYQEFENSEFLLKIYDFKNKSIDTIRTIKNFDTYSYRWLDNQNLYFSYQGKKIYNLQTKELIDTAFIEYPKRKNKVDVSKLKELTKNIPYRDWDIKLMECCPPKSKDFVDIITNPQKGNIEYRMLLLYEIGNQLSKKDVDEILKRFAQQRAQIKESSRFLFDRDYKEMMDYLKELKEGKN